MVARYEIEARRALLNLKSKYYATICSYERREGFLDAESPTGSKGASQQHA